MNAKTGTHQADVRREPEDLQREAEAIRADLNRTLNALERKLSPRQLLGRSLDFMQANGGDVLQKIGATVNKHPLPLLLTSAGLIWLVASSRSRSSAHRAGSSTARRSGDFDTTSQSFRSSFSSSSMEDKASSLRGSMEDKASGLKARAQRTVDATRERASRTWGATRDRTQELGQNLNGLIREQPLVCGAIALAVGAVVGAAFPASAYERNLVGRARQAGGDILDDMTSPKEPLAGTTTEQSSPTSH